MSDGNIQKIRDGDVRSVSSAITKIENSINHKLISDLYPFIGNAFRIGITGPPGAGKSTLTDNLINLFRNADKKVGVIVVDPTSPFTGGALLGDRVRMITHHDDPGVYIRSMASRGNQGGLAEKTREAGDLLDAAGYDVILFETVGVGQVELDVIQTTDTVVVILVPESGDDIQMMKAGLMEIGDIFVINKSDREGADKLEIAIRQLFSITPRKEEDWEVPIIKTIATQNIKINILFEFILKHQKFTSDTGIIHKKLQNRYKQQVKEIINKKYAEEFWKKSRLQLLEDVIQKNKISWPSPLQFSESLLKNG